jgi:hypothetical protein
VFGVDVVPRKLSAETDGNTNANQDTKTERLPIKESTLR